LNRELLNLEPLGLELSVLHYTAMVDVEPGRFTVGVFQDVAWAAKGIAALVEAGLPPASLTIQQQGSSRGELHFLRARLIPLLGGAAVAGWKGPEGAHQDFQFSGAWIEVKTTLAKQPQTVRIASECQLDDTRAPAFFLHVLALETHEGGAATLPSEVAAVREALGAWPSARENFEEALLAAGYLDQHAPRYAAVGYAVRQAQDYRVGPGFPRIVEADLATGVGEVSYALSLAACARFTALPETISTALGAGSLFNPP